MTTHLPISESTRKIHEFADLLAACYLNLTVQQSMEVTDDLLKARGIQWKSRERAIESCEKQAHGIMPDDGPKDALRGMPSVRDAYFKRIHDAKQVDLFKVTLALLAFTDISKVY